MASQMRGFPFEFFVFSKQYTFFSTLFPKSVLQKSVLDLKKVQKCTIVQKKCFKKVWVGGVGGGGGGGGEFFGALKSAPQKAHL